MFEGEYLTFTQICFYEHFLKKILKKFYDSNHRRNHELHWLLDDILDQQLLANFPKERYTHQFTKIYQWNKLDYVYFHVRFTDDKLKKFIDLNINSISYRKLFNMWFHNQQWYKLEKLQEQRLKENQKPKYTQGVLF